MEANFLLGTSQIRRTVSTNFMTSEHRIILEKLKEYLEQNPSQRFGQAIFNLGINEFKLDEEYQLRDIYNDNDLDIIKRIEKRLELFHSQIKK